MPLKDNDEKLLATLQRGLRCDNGEVGLSYARALVQNWPESSVSLILPRVADLDVKAADQMVRLLDRTVDVCHVDMLEQAMQAGDEHLRATVFGLLVKVKSG